MTALNIKSSEFKNIKQYTIVKKQGNFIKIVQNIVTLE